MSMKEIDLFIDESGNPGRGRGRYFTIACVAVNSINTKRVQRKMKKETLKIKQNYPNKNWRNGEVKAASLRKEERASLVSKIVQTPISIYYITIDKYNIREVMFEDKSRSYNYWLKLIIDNVLADNTDCLAMNIYIDNRNTKIASGNSFDDYIHIHVQMELVKDINLNIKYLDSHKSFGIQIADFISNGINLRFMNQNDIIYKEFNTIYVCAECFPRKNFGK